MASNPATTLSPRDRFRVRYSAPHRICCGGLFRDPFRFLRWTGLLKYHPISHADFDTEAFDTPRLFNAPLPPSADSQPWSVSQASGNLMNHVVTVEKGLATCFGHVFDRRGRLIEGATHKHREGRSYPKWIKRRNLVQSHGRFPGIHAYKEPVAVLTASTQHLYFHWLLDILPRIAMIEGHLHDGGRLFAASRHRFQKETFMLLGLDPEQIIDTAAVPVVTALKLVVPCHQIMKGRQFPVWSLEFLRERLLPKALADRSPEGTKIYISRQGASSRKPTNEGEIIDRLNVHGFKAVELEKLRLPEQIRLFRDARVVVAPHGAGLANLVFCSPGTTVIELFPAANLDLYYRLCIALDLNYFFAKGTGGDPERVTPVNYHIPLDTLEKTLKVAAII